RPIDGGGRRRHDRQSVGPALLEIPFDEIGAARHPRRTARARRPLRACTAAGASRDYQRLGTHRRRQLPQRSRQDCACPPAPQPSRTIWIAESATAMSCGAAGAACTGAGSATKPHTATNATIAARINVSAELEKRVSII